MIQYLLGGLCFASAIFAPPWADYQGVLFVLGLGFIAWGWVDQPDEKK